jgi:hypothetical protein
MHYVTATDHITSRQPSKYKAPEGLSNTVQYYQQCTKCTYDSKVLPISHSAVSPVLWIT